MTNLPLVSQEDAGLPALMRASRARVGRTSQVALAVREHHPSYLLQAPRQTRGSCNVCGRVAAVGLKHPLGGQIR